MFLILTVSVVGGGAISIVWLRMEISATAKNCGKLEDQREMVARELRELRGKKSAMMRPSTIAQLVKGRLRVPSPQKTVHVTQREMNSYMNSKIARNDDLRSGQSLNRR